MAFVVIFQQLNNCVRIPVEYYLDKHVMDRIIENHFDSSHNTFESVRRIADIYEWGNNVLWPGLFADMGPCNAVVGVPDAATHKGCNDDAWPDGEGSFHQSGHADVTRTSAARSLRCRASSPALAAHDFQNPGARELRCRLTRARAPVLAQGDATRARGDGFADGSTRLDGGHSDQAGTPSPCPQREPRTPSCGARPGPHHARAAYICRRGDAHPENSAPHRPHPNPKSSARAPPRPADSRAGHCVRHDRPAGRVLP
eukprot:3282493-Prymnesium_polylepis.1